MLNFSGKHISQLHIGLIAVLSFNTFQKANPFLDSHDQPLAAKVSAESSMNLPSYTTDCMSPSLQTHTPPRNEKKAARAAHHLRATEILLLLSSQIA
jgi:hypothetical protein